MKRVCSLILVLALLVGIFTGCGDRTSGVSTGNAENTTASGSDSGADAEKVDFSTEDGEMFTDRDLAGTYENGQTITLGSGNVTIDSEGVYILTGTLEDGMIIVNAGEKDKIQLVLDGVDIYSSTGAAICCLEADKLFITLAPGSENTLAVGDTVQTVGDHEMNGAIYSRCDLTMNGEGSLTVTAPAGHGVTCKDDLAITGGSYTINSANQGLDANDSVRICGGSFAISAGKDGIHAENADDASQGYVYISGGTFNVEAQGDGVSAGSWLQVEDGTFDLLCGGGYENGSNQSSGSWGDMGGGFGGGMGGGRPRSGVTSTTVTETESSSMKGLKAAGGILISGGTFSIDSADDAIHSDASVTVNGGTFTIATGDDGIHAEENLIITACTMDITTAYEGLEAAYLYVRGGDITMVCSDDGLNAAGGADSSGTTGGRDGMFGGGMGMSSDYGYIEISGGNLTIHACGDGLDSNGDLLISGGCTYVDNPRSGDVSVLDSENQPVITGGTYIGLGISTTMAETFSSSKSTQGVIACTVGNQSAGTEFTIADSDGNVLISCTGSYTTVLMIVSCPEMVKGESYTVTAGSLSGTLEAS